MVGMRQQMNRMDVLSNNIANVDTAGFKKDSVASRSFTEELMVRVHDPRMFLPSRTAPVGPFSSGVMTDEVFTDFSPGSLHAETDPLAAAITGPGFFTVSYTLPTGEVVQRYTRDGAFTLNNLNQLMTKDGGYVLGQGGEPVTIPLEQGLPTIDGNGNISQNGVLTDTLLMADFTDYTTLRKVGNNCYEITPQTQMAAFTGRIEQGYLEDSNVNAVKEMVDLINVSRLYDANQRFVTAHDAILNRAVNDVARRA
jgi:flagellar basal-body rod protein FlgG